MEQQGEKFLLPPIPRTEEETFSTAAHTCLPSILILRLHETGEVLSNPKTDRQGLSQVQGSVARSDNRALAKTWTDTLHRVVSYRIVPTVSYLACLLAIANQPNKDLPNAQCLQMHGMSSPTSSDIRTNGSQEVAAGEIGAARHTAPF